MSDGTAGDTADDAQVVSWLTITPGLPVVAADGEQVGTVVEVAGLPEDDIFHGVLYKAGSATRLAPAADVDHVTARAVHLGVDSATAARHEEPEGSSGHGGLRGRLGL